jgi:hypothetical protein
MTRSTSILRILSHLVVLLGFLNNYIPRLAKSIRTEENRSVSADRWITKFIVHIQSGREALVNLLAVL